MRSDDTIRTELVKNLRAASVSTAPAVARLVKQAAEIEEEVRELIAESQATSKSSQTGLKRPVIKKAGG